MALVLLDFRDFDWGWRCVRPTWSVRDVVSTGTALFLLFSEMFQRCDADPADMFDSHFLQALDNHILHICYSFPNDAHSISSCDLIVAPCNLVSNNNNDPH